jgi:hypothetical protein
MRDPSEPSGAPGEGFTSITAPSPLRLAGFLGTVLGALGMGVATVLTWLTVHDAAGSSTVLDRVYVGLDLTAGKAVVIAAMVLLIGLMALRGARTRPAQKVIAIVMLVAAIAGLAFALVILIGGGASYAEGGQDSVGRGPGLYLAVAGGVVGVFGAVLDVAWAVAPVAPVMGADEPTSESRPL